jgi:hypothetical protein
MRKIITLVVVITGFLGTAQIKLNATELNNLVALGVAFSSDPNMRTEAFVKTMDSVKVKRFEHVIEVMVECGKAKENLLASKFLARPTQEDLQFFYVIRQIHYNLQEDNKNPKPNDEVAQTSLAQTIDSNKLLDNYYNMIHGGLATLLNEADLSSYNIDMASLGFKDATEKSIFFFNFVEALIGQRLMVLMSLKKYDRILFYTKKMPKINGQPYFYHLDLDFPDFKEDTYEGEKSFSQENFAAYYNTLISHFMAFSETKEIKAAQEIYFKSILFKEPYFKFSPMKEDLMYLYKESKK